MDLKLNDKGFTLVEVLLAVAVSTIVFGALTAMIIFASRSTKLTNERITIQEEVRDAMNHIQGYCMEAETAAWQDISLPGGASTKALIVFQYRDDVKAVTAAVSDGAITVKPDQVETLTSYAYVYWYTGGRLYFGKCSDGGDIKLTDLKQENRYLLADHITDFTCDVHKNKTSGKYTIDIKVDGQINNSQYSSNETVYLRNQ